MTRTQTGLLVLLLATFSSHARAHGLAAALVSIESEDDYQADVLVKLPEVEGRAPSLSVRFADDCTELAAPRQIKRKGSVIERWTIRCERPLTGMEIELVGLNAILGEALVDFRSPSVAVWSTVVRRGTTSARLGASQIAGLDSSTGYFPLGIEHIVFGFDHVLFILALMLVVWRARSNDGPRAVLNTMLVTITAFTLGHSVTLAAATLGVASLARAPTELLIALSVLLLAVELARDDRSTLTMRFPWVVAAAFGLLHGFGFAGALADIGLPPNGIAAPLFMFNLGVEVGQLLIVGTAALVVAVAHAALGNRPLAPHGSLVQRAAIYGIGTLTAYWCFERSLEWIM